MASDIVEESTVTEETKMEQEENIEGNGPPAVSNEAPQGGRKRPRIDLTTDSRERKRGKSMFGILLGTLNKAKQEDHDRNSSEAARKRADIDRRLQTQLAEEHDSVRRAEELKRDRQTANRKEEDLKLKESLFRLRRTRLPALAHFLLTSDKIPRDGELSESSNPLALPPRTHPPPLYYLPAVLLPSQAKLQEKRVAETKEAIEKEWASWETQRKQGYEEINKLRARAEEEEKRFESNKTGELAKLGNVSDDDTKMDEDDDHPRRRSYKDEEQVGDGEMAMAADGDDAVEY
ncbi:hypothetical protein Clacol_002636 [Clathrus columnatus]|uniref:Pinin/SDK/MemA protein domain-containing protein n=1 Tax=Clathrus columnatus TaxID=1419009 RepID=A0AAV5A627_9AGAM|nr:hypothetical protein Clacol_002636 [Clathrus columnatus]